MNPLLEPRDPLKLYEEDPDGDGLADHTSTTWKLWASDAVTVFCRGALSGLFPGLGGGVTGVALTETSNILDMIKNGAVGFGLGIFVKGLERFHVWQLQPENEMPNPKRASPRKEKPVTMVPKKDDDRGPKPEILVAATPPVVSTVTPIAEPPKN